jgi:glucose-6-phosphate isomerase
VAKSSLNHQNNVSSTETTNALDSLAEPSYQKQQDHQTMNPPIKFYYKNVTEEVIGPDHGLSRGKIVQMATRITKITESMASQRESGNLAYRDLPYQNDTIQKISKLANQLKGRFDNLVVLGIGGSALGNIALQTALNSATYNLLTNDQRPGPRLFVIDNVDPDQLNAILDFLDDQLDRTLFNVISKSGRTAETAAHFLTMCEMLKNKLGPDQLKDHIVATTDTTSGTLRSIVNREGFTSLEVPDGVGGRFSVLSDVGLFSAAMCGIDIKELLAGAAAMDERVKTSDLAKNPAAMYAAIQYSFYQAGKPLSVMMPYSYQLKDLSDWFRQLWAESLGKQTDLKGNEVFVGPTPINALGTTDQHSQVQLYREGPNDKIFTFLEVEKFAAEVIIGDAGDVTELSYLSGRKMSDLINAEKQGTEYALLKSNRPCLTLKFPAINAHTVGQFIYFFEVATSYFGELLGINTYDQPAVELGKEATFALMGHSEWTDLLKQIETTTEIDPEFLL